MINEYMQDYVNTIFVTEIKLKLFLFLIIYIQ